MTLNRAEKKQAKPLQLASLKNIKAAWKASRDASGKGGASGLDRITPAQFRGYLETNLIRLREKLISEPYKFSKLKPHFIEKDGGGFRVICVPTVEDRLVQRLILRALTWDSRKEIEKDRLRVKTSISYGSGKGTDQGLHSALNKALDLRTKHPWVLKTDISKFFDRIPRAYLKSAVKSRLKNSSLVPFIESAIDCEISISGQEAANRIKNCGITPGLGLRQGMPLSPLLSNLVLNSFDRKIEGTDLRVIRYADDLIVFCDNESEAKEALKFIENELKKVELSVPSIEEASKTVIKKPEEPVIFLGAEIYQQKNNTYAKKVPQNTWKEALRRVQQHKNLKWCLAEGYKYTDVIRRLSDIPDGYETAFKDCTNLSSLLGELRKEAALVKKELIQGIFGEDILNKLTAEEKEFIGFP